MITVVHVSIFVLGLAIGVLLGMLTLSLCVTAVAANREAR